VTTTAGTGLPEADALLLHGDELAESEEVFKFEDAAVDKLIP
jgi:hypothetical protein